MSVYYASLAVCACRIRSCVAFTYNHDAIYFFTACFSLALSLSQSLALSLSLSLSLTFFSHKKPLTAIHSVALHTNITNIFNGYFSIYLIGILLCTCAGIRFNMLVMFARARTALAVCCCCCLHSQMHKH